MVGALLGSAFKAYILEATRTLHIQHEFSDCKCDSFLSDTTMVFPQGGATKIKSKAQFIRPDWAQPSANLI